MLMFPKGAPPDLGSLYGILTNPTFASSPSDVLRTPPDGDYPQKALTRLKIDIGPYNPGAPIGQICRLSMYDWIRNAGAGLNIDSLVAAINAPIGPDTSTHRLWYDVDVNGNISQRSEACLPSSTLPCSQRQMYGISAWLSIQATAIATTYLSETSVITWALLMEACMPANRLCVPGGHPSLEPSV